MANRTPAPANSHHSLSLEPSSNRSEVIVGESRSENAGEDGTSLVSATPQDPEKSQWSAMTCLIPKHSRQSSPAETHTTGRSWGSPKARQPGRERGVQSEDPNNESESSERLTRLASPPPPALVPLSVYSQHTASAGRQAEQRMSSPDALEEAGLSIALSKPLSAPMILPWSSHEPFDFSMCRKAKLSCSDSGYGSLSISESNVDLEAAKDVPVSRESPLTTASAGPLQSRQSPSSTVTLYEPSRTRDSGYASDTPVHSRALEPQKPGCVGESCDRSPDSSEGPAHPTFPSTRDAMVQTDPLLCMQDGPSTDLGPPSGESDWSATGQLETPTGVGTATNFFEQNPIARKSEVSTADTPFTDLAGTDFEDEESVANEEKISDPPLPWKVANSAESERLLVQTVWRFVDAFNDIASSEESADDCHGNLEAASPRMMLTDGAGTQPSESESAHSSLPTAGPVYSVMRTNLPRPLVRGGNDPAKDWDDGDEDEPSRKRPKLLTPLHPRQRFACPYQKYDAMGSPFCLPRSTKNPAGGADSFSRIKSHVLRIHDRSIRCRNCWKICKTREEAETHQNETNCNQRVEPVNHWITREQEERIRTQRFNGPNIASWFCLFQIVLPQVPSDGYTPYFEQSQPILSSSTPSSAWSGNRSSSSGQTQSSGPTAPCLPHSAESMAGSQILPYPFYDAENPDISFSPFPNSLNAGSTMDGILQWDDSNNAVDGPIDQATQSQLASGVQHPQPQPVLPQTAPAIPDPLAAQPVSGQASSGEGDQPPNPSSEFLQRDMKRLRNNNDRLRDEVVILRRRDREMRAQLDELRDSIGPMEHLLQELLYAPAVQNGERAGSNRLFAIFDLVEAINQALSAAACGR